MQVLKGAFQLYQAHYCVVANIFQTDFFRLRMEMLIIAKQIGNCIVQLDAHISVKPVQLMRSSDTSFYFELFLPTVWDLWPIVPLYSQGFSQTAVDWLTLSSPCLNLKNYVLR